jgi:hypothetical protein
MVRQFGWTAKRMRRRQMSKGRMIIVLATVLVLVAAGTAYAGVAATSSSTSQSLEPTTTWTPAAPPGGKQHVTEVPLQGDVLAQVVAAAIAKIGADATVVRAETDADGNAAYEVHMVRADGTTVTVYVDESFNVVGVAQREEEETCGEDNSKKPWDEQNRGGETPLEGDVLAAVVAAATLRVGTDADVIRAETDADGNAAYEVHLVTADGRLMTVYVNEAYAVVSVVEKQKGGHFGEVQQDQLHQQDRLSDGEQAKDRSRDKNQTQTTTQTQTTSHTGDHNGDRTGTGGRDGDSHDGGGFDR